MILKETILSAFTERGTLLKWLKKVEAALNNAVLTDISVEQVSATQVKLKFTFENGDFVESPVLTLPRGEKGEPGKDGLDGQGIAATIEVGTVTTGAAGTNASVTNVGTEQRAILNFVIPRGDEGNAGFGFDDADEISINDGAVNITAGENGVNIEASFEVAVGEEILEIPSTMYLPLKGSESIVIDVDESGDFIEVHLDADIAAKLGRVLVTPMSAPASVSLVAVDTSNAQAMLTVGDGLTVEGGALKATGGGGGGASNFYAHFVKIDNAYIGIITRDSESLVGKTLGSVAVLGTLRHTTAGTQYFYGGDVIGAMGIPTGFMFFNMNTSNSTITTKTIASDATFESDVVEAI